jgi:hypothetical protein
MRIGPSRDIFPRRMYLLFLSFYTRSFFLLYGVWKKKKRDRIGRTQQVKETSPNKNTIINSPPPYILERSFSNLRLGQQSGWEVRSKRKESIDLFSKSSF